MLEILLEVIWLGLPAGIANSMPVIAAKYNWVPSLAVPLDGGRGILGKNKTVRGVVVGVIFASIVGYIQHLLYGYPAVQEISLVSYEPALAAITYGALLGFGALAGDAAKSFLKRKRGIPSGQPWRPFDQFDFIVGAFVIAMLFASVTVWHVAVAIIFFGLISFATSVTGYKLGIKKSI